MVQLEHIEPEDFDEIYAEFLEDDDPRFSREDWQRLFSLSGDGEASRQLGYRLDKAGRTVGILGTVFSQQAIGDRMEQFCNLHSWFVKPEYRGYSLLLLRPILKLRDYTITDFTPTDDVCKIERRLGFRGLDSTVRILPPLPLWSRYEALECHEGNEISVDGLDAATQRIVVDPRVSHLHRFAFSKKGETSVVICSRVTLHWRPYCYIVHVQNPDFLAKNSLLIRARLCRALDSSFVAVDDRLLTSPIPWSIALPRRTRQLFRSNRLSPHQISPVFTEVSALNLCTFPKLLST